MRITDKSLVFGMYVCFLIGPSAPSFQAQQAPAAIVNREALAAVLSEMEDPAWEVRAKALYQLITLGLGKAPNGRTDLFKSALAQLYVSAPESGDRLTVAIGRLAERENELSRRPHGEDFANYYGDVIAALYSAVQVSPDPRLLDPVIGALNTGGMALNALVRFGDAAVPRLIVLTHDPNPSFRGSALAGLQRMLQPEVLSTMKEPLVFRANVKKIFLERLSDENPLVRSEAVTGLGVLRDRDVIPRLEAIALTDPECFKGQKADDGSGDLCPVRMYARRALASLLSEAPAH